MLLKQLEPNAGNFLIVLGFFAINLVPNSVSVANGAILLSKSALKLTKAALTVKSLLLMLLSTMS